MEIKHKINGNLATDESWVITNGTISHKVNGHITDGNGYVVVDGVIKQVINGNVMEGSEWVLEGTGGGSSDSEYIVLGMRSSSQYGNVYNPESAISPFYTLDMSEGDVINLNAYVSKAIQDKASEEGKKVIMTAFSGKDGSFGSIVIPNKHKEMEITENGVYKLDPKTDDLTAYYNGATIIVNVAGGGNLVWEDGMKMSSWSNVMINKHKDDDFSGLTDFSHFFEGSSLSGTAPEWLSTVKPAKAYRMFFACYALKEITALDTSEVTDFQGMFARCTTLHTLPLLDFTNADPSIRLAGQIEANPFVNSNRLTNVGGFKNLSVSLDFSKCNILTQESVANIINNLAEPKDELKKLAFHPNVYSAISEDLLASASAKGWSIISA